MSILIKSMEMPTNCYDCPCNKDDGFGFFTCGVTKAECDFIRLPSNCPLVPVPKHGDLKDADALLKKCEFVCTDGDEDIRAVRYSIIENAPTIIKAEEGEA